MRKIFLLLLTLINFKGIAQTAASYSFSAFTGTYTSISTTGTLLSATGGTCGLGIIGDDCTVTSIPIGFTFNFCGTNYTQLAVCSNGFISLSNSSAAPYTNDIANLSSIGSGVGVLMPYWDDLEGFSSIPSHAYYQTSGSAPNRTFTFEWYNFGTWGGTSSCPSCPANFQVILYETSNVIDFVYGSSTYSGRTATIGIANSTTDYQTLPNSGTSPIPSSSTFTSSISTSPATNQVYRWANQCSGTPVTGTIHATVDSSCSTFTSVLSLPTSSIGSGLSYQWQSSTDGTTWTNISGATAATYTATVSVTTWYRCIISCSYSGLSATSPPIELFLHNPPSAITGRSTICSGSTTTLTDTTSGGTWSSSSSSVASVGSSTGIVTGGAVGTAVISYTLSTGCSTTFTINVVTSPAAISGASSVCVGATTTFSDATPGGTWVSSAPGTATVGATTGLVTGIASGVATITYAIGSCQITKTITVNPSPGAISGPSAVCVGYSITLTDTSTGGTWVSSIPGIATVGSATGIVTGVFAGVAVISYVLPGGCSSTHPVTVNALPGGITGYPLVCVGQTTTLFDFGGGTWTSANTSIATVGSSTGVVTGVSSGSTTITYSLPTGCYTTFTVTVQPLPGAITGSLNVCVGSTDTLSDTSAGGLWSSVSITGTATIDPFSGVLTGISAGTVVVSYTLAGGTGCSTTATVNVNPSPGTITGTPTVCVGSTTLLFDAGGGTWTSSNPSVATIGSATGIVTGINTGVTIINYTLPTGCSTATIVTVNPLPLPITGTMTVCVGLTTALSDATPGGTWSSSNPAVGTISTAGVVTGISAGTTVITYTRASTGCYTTATVTVNSSPAPIACTLNVCVGATTTVCDPTPGGTWSISPTAVGTITSGGVVGGVSAGLATVTYSLGAGCQTTAVVTVNALPLTISGTGSLCVGATATLSSTSGVTWSSSTTAIATIGSSSGVVTGTGPGLATITATNPVTGCFRTRTETVNPVPAAITGIFSVCQGHTATETDISSGGTWSSTPISVATIGSATGILTGVSAGLATISYTIGSTGCSATATVTVNGLPPVCPVTGGGNYCAGGTGVVIGLGCSSVGMSYQLYYLGSALGSPVMGTGGPISFGLQTGAGTYTVTATNTGTGCSSTMSGSATININPAPTPISGASAVCVSATTTETSSPTGGGWSSSAPGIAIIGGTTGIVTGIHTGTAIITYTLPTGCNATKTITVSPSPGPIGGPAIACTGSSATTLTDTVAGGIWTSSNPAVASIGSLSGIVTGGSTGTATITYSLGSGCTVTRALTVDASPSPISGSLDVCQGLTTTLSDPTSGGSWSSGSLATATIGSATGIASGIAAGTATISYTLPSGCSATAILTVNPLPAPIIGTPIVCAGSSTLLSGSIPGGMWSSSTPSIATVSPLTGTVGGVAAGTATITYTLSDGCRATRIVTVNPVPLPISGSARICTGLSTTLSDATAGGSWRHTTPAVAALSGATETGLTAGTDTVYYTLSTGCNTSQVITVNPVPTPFFGPTGVCVSQTITLGDAVPGGTWSSGAPAIVTIGSTTGVVLGVSFGTAPITYTAGGCSVTGTVNVVSSPAPITGLPSVCTGQTTIFADPTTGGIWTSSLPTEATVGSSSGIVTGISSGTVIISYTLGTGCTAVKSIVVNPIGPILGSPTVCAGQTIILVDTTLSGTWSSGTPAVATIGSITGIVTGVAAGTTLITYTLATGCTATMAVTVNGVPPAITGPSVVCQGQTITESDPAGGGTWSSSDPAIATISSSGIITGMSAGIVTISYSLPAIGCPATKTVTVNGLPAGISGPSQLCAGGSVSLHDGTGGGTWSSSTPSVAAIGSISGVVSGIAPGTSIISYTLPTGCATSMTVTVNTALPPLSGPTQYCVGATIALIPPTGGGTWSSSAPLVVDPSLVAISPGASLITYTVSAGCAASAMVTVNSTPAPITGTTNICQGATSALHDATGGGTWSSYDTTIAAIGTATGIMTGMGAGSTTITYSTTGLGCIATMPVNINPGPAPISGASGLCAGATTTLGDATFGGTWSSTNPAVATIDAAGDVSGITAGVTTISYTLPTGCAATLTETVNIHPGPITGLVNLCPGNSAVLSVAPAGGTWSTTTPAIVAMSGDTVTAFATGSPLPVPATIVYTLGAGCSSTATLYVNPVPDPISGPGNVCATQAITLTDPTAGGAWSSTSPAIGTVDVAGNMTGITAGVTTISYTNSYSCAATHAVTVNPMPGPILGSPNVCLGGTSSFSDVMTGGTWLSTNPAVATIGSSSGIVSGRTIGSATIIYELPPTFSCFVSKVINVFPLPNLYTVTGGGNHCAGDTGVHIGLSGSSLGVNYMLYLGATAVGTFPGTGYAMDFGLHTVRGTYTVTGTSTLSGCTANMIGTVTVNVLPAVTPAIAIHTTPGDTICAGTTTTFTTTITNGGTSPAYQWSVNGIPVALTAGYSYIPADGDIVKVSLTSTATCATPATVSSMETMHVQPFVNPVVNLTALPGDTVCQGTAVSVRAVTEYGGTAPNYTWIKNGAPVAVHTASDVYTWVARDGDVIYCTLYSNYPCRLSSSDTSSPMAIHVDTPQALFVTITGSAGTSVGVGQHDTLAATVTGAAPSSYQWYVNGLPVAGATTATFVYSSYTTNQEDSVSCEVTSAGICPTQGHQWVYIHTYATGIQQVAAGGDIEILPNPNKGTFAVKGSIGTADQQVTLELTDMLGRNVYKKTVAVKGGKLDVQVTTGGLANGMYLLTLHSDSDSKVFHVTIEQ